VGVVRCRGVSGGGLHVLAGGAGRGVRGDTRVQKLRVCFCTITSMSHGCGYIFNVSQVCHL
jgi:hypothetical protein